MMSVQLCSQVWSKLLTVVQDGGILMIGIRCLPAVYQQENQRHPERLPESAVVGKTERLEAIDALRRYPAIRFHQHPLDCNQIDPPCRTVTTDARRVRVHLPAVDHARSFSGASRDAAVKRWLGIAGTADPCENLSFEDPRCHVGFFGALRLFLRSRPP